MLGLRRLEVAVAVEQQVGRLEVAVQHVRGVDVLERAQDLEGDMGRYGEIWGDMGRCGEVWGGVRRIWLGKYRQWSSVSG